MEYGPQRPDPFAGEEDEEEDEDEENNEDEDDKKEEEKDEDSSTRIWIARLRNNKKNKKEGQRVYSTPW